MEKHIALPDVSASICNLIYELCQDAKEALSKSFVGFYIHGSYAMSGFNPERSDLDYIIVCLEEPGFTVKKKLLDSAENHWADAPAKGLEMHLMRLEDSLNPADEPAFVLHYSDMHREAFQKDPENYIGYMHGNDDDLNAHVTVMRARGICVDGRPIEEVFGKVAKANYLKSLISDMGWDKAQTTYHVLNAARTLAYLREGMVLSKLEGGQWCLANVPEFKDVIEEAVTCCQRSQEMTASDAAESFCRYVHEKTCRELISLQCE